MSKVKGTVTVASKSHATAAGQKQHQQHNSKTVINPMQQGRAANTLVATEKTDNAMPSINTDFLVQQREQIKTAKTQINRLNDAVQRFEKSILQKDRVIKELRNKIKASTPESCRSSVVDYDRLKVECIQYRKMYQEIKDKYSILETNYDSNYLQLCQKFEHLTVQQSEEHLSLVEQIKTLTEKLHASHENKKQQQKQLNQCEIELRTVKAAHDTQKGKATKEKEALINEYELKLTEVRNELKLKDDSIQKCQLEKEELKVAKNKIIDEQAYKLQQVNRAIDQPTVIVPPVSSHAAQTNKVTPMSKKFDSIRNNEDFEQDRASSSLGNGSKRQQSVHPQQQHELTTLKQTNRSEHNIRLRAKERQLNYFENDSSDDESIDIGWQPTICSNDSTQSSRPTPNAFNILKRQNNDVLVPESSDSEKNRLLAKRLKKNST